MKRHSIETDIFRQGSRTYSVASRFFPSSVRRKVTLLYSFVRVADNYVDDIPQDKKSFVDLEHKWRHYNGAHHDQLSHATGDTINSRVAKNMARLCVDEDFEHEWVETFLRSMRSDIAPVPIYRTMDDTLSYIDGSAEVIGLMLARILGLPPQADDAARQQGRAMQYINFIRDIAEDMTLGRCYFPLEERSGAGIDEWSVVWAKKHADIFADFIRLQIRHYRQWQTSADRGLSLIPRRYRIAVLIARRGYDWTANRIADDPSIVLRRQLKPSKARLLLWAIRYTLYARP